MTRLLLERYRKAEGSDFGDLVAQLPTAPDGAPLQPVDVIAITLNVFDKTENTKDANGNPVPIFTIQRSPALLIKTTYQHDNRWTKDTLGYNFIDSPTAAEVFAATKEVGGHVYRLEYILEGPTGHFIPFAWEGTSWPIFSIPSSAGGGGGSNPDFALSVTPATASIVAGSSTQFIVADVASNGFTGSLQLSSSPSIPGLNITFASNPLSHDSQTTMTVTTTGSTPAQDYTITVTAVSGSIVHQKSIVLTVTAAPADFSLASTPPTVSVDINTNVATTIQSTKIGNFTGTIALVATPTITGITYTLNPTSISESGSSTLTIAAGNTAVAGDYTVTVTGTSGALVHTCTVALHVNAIGSGTTGYTKFVPSSDTNFPTRQIFVANAGSGANDGLSSSTPKQTIAQGRALLRAGFPDWLLLKCGDTFNEQLHPNCPSGWRATDKMLFSSYGSGARPIVNPGNQDAMFGQGVSFVAIVGLHLRANSYDGMNGGVKGVEWLSGGDSKLIEDCYIDNFNNGLVIMAGGGVRQSNTSVRRSIIVDCYDNNGSGGNGLFLADGDNWLIEENVIDQNGWSVLHPGLNGATGHSLYAQNGVTGFVLRGNIIGRADGAQMRSGGLAEDNLFLNCAIAYQFGEGVEPDGSGVTGVVRRNCFVDGGDGVRLVGGVQDPNWYRGWAIRTGNVASAQFYDNVITKNTSGNAPRPFYINDSATLMFQNVTFQHNLIYKWGSQSGTIGSKTASPFSNFIISTSDFQIYTEDQNPLIQVANDPTQIHSANNRFYSQRAPNNAEFQLNGANMSLIQYKAATGDPSSVNLKVSYPDPERDITTYMTSIGGAPSLAAFMQQARLNSKASYNTNFTAYAVNTYIRAGFAWTTS